MEAAPDRRSEKPAGPPALARRPGPSRHGPTLRHRLTILVLGALLPFALLSSGFAYLSFRSERERALAQAVQVARGLGLSVDREVRAMAASLEALSLSRSLTVGDLPAFRREALTLVARRFPGGMVALVQPDGQLLLHTLVAGGTPLPRRSATDNLQRVVARGEASVSDVFVSPVTRTPVFTVDVPVPDESGRAGLVLSLVVPPSLLEDVIRQQQLPADWSVTVLDRTAACVVQVPRGGGCSTGQVAGEPLRSHLRSQPDGHWTSGSGPGTATVWSRPLPDGWTVVMEIPAAELMLPLWRWLAATAAAVVLAVTVALLLARRFAGDIARPIHALVDHAARGRASRTPNLGFAEADAVAERLAQVQHERELANRTLQDSEARFRTMADNIPQLAWMADPDGQVFWFSQRWFEYSGTTMADMQGQGWVKVLHPDHVERVMRHVQDCMQAGRPWEDTFPLRAADGEWRWFLSRALPIRDGEGHITHWFGTNTDVTDQRAARELALAQARVLEMVATGRPLDDTLDALIRLVQSREPGARCGIVVRRRDGAHIDQSVGPSLPVGIRAVLDGMSTVPPYVSCCGEASDLGELRTVADLDTDDRYAGPWRDQLRGAGLRSVRCTPILGPDGASLGAFAVYGTGPGASALRDPAMIETATHLAAIAILRWRTEDTLRDSEAALRRLNEDLESRVAREVAAREAAQSQLAHAQRMEALGQLAGGIAHDFNNVLQAASNCAALLQRRARDPDTVQRLSGMVQAAAERGAAVTRRLLTFARRGELRAQVVDPDVLLLEMREMLAHTLGAQVQVHAEAADDAPKVSVDRGQMETVLVNLGTNARDAMPAGGTLTLSATRGVVEPDGPSDHPPGLHPGTYLRVAVADTGQGMPPEVLAHATEPFFTTKARGQGTGLGLAMARGFAEQSGGGLSVTSTVGRGTRVDLWLPAADVPQVDRPAPAGPAEPATATPAGEGVDGRSPGDDAPAHVLLVDDDRIVRDVTAEALAGAGFAVRAVASAEEALAVIARLDPVDLLISDLAMPGMSGRELIHQARRRRPGLPALLLTGHAGDGADQEAADGDGVAFAVVRKPVSPDDLARCARERLHDRVPG